MSCTLRQMSAVNSEHLEFPPRSLVRTWNIRWVIDIKISSVLMVEAKFIVIFNDWSYFFFTYGVEAGGLNLFSVPMKSHVAQHHDGTQQKGGGVRHVFACDVGGSSVYLTHHFFFIMRHGMMLFDQSLHCEAIAAISASRFQYILIQIWRHHWLRCFHWEWLQDPQSIRHTDHWNPNQSLVRLTLCR